MQMRKTFMKSVLNQKKKLTSFVSIVQSDMVSSATTKVQRQMS